MILNQIFFLVFINLNFLLNFTEIVASVVTQSSVSVNVNGAVEQNDSNVLARPFVDGSKTFINGEIKEWADSFDLVTSPIIDKETGERILIGKLAQMKSADADQVLKNSISAWSNGRGVWPQMTAEARIKAIENVVKDLKERRDEIIKILMWEICKSADDAAAEFDRTMTFIEATIEAFRQIDGVDGAWKVVNGIMARVRRAAIGIILCLGPFNYPFNETYATLIPALLAGNIVIMKIPTVGGLAHVLTMEAYAKYLPPGTLNFISGSGRETMPTLMKSGSIDMLAFIGGSKAADDLIKSHPHPHKLKLFLQLEGKNLGVVLGDADIDTAVEQITIGSTTYNGQRCTAIKLVFLPKALVETFLPKFKAKISSLVVGLPWESNVSITPLPQQTKPKYLFDLIADARAKGAEVINEDTGGGQLSGSLMKPAIVYPVTSDMRLWHEEQFGPVIPIAVYEDIEEVYDYLARTPFGQQAAVFTKSAEASAELIDILSTIVGRININTQCGRSPDVFPFSARRSSALGTMSITEALRSFSIETVVAAKKTDLNENILIDYEKYSKFLYPMQSN